MGRHVSLRQLVAMELQHGLDRSYREAHPLRQLFWECTLRCNLHCRHCGSDCKAIADTEDMPIDTFCKVLDDIAAHTDPRGVFVVVTGGEPLMRPDLEECGRQISSRGFGWGMVSNGFALTPERFERLLGAGLSSITISLDGLEANHDWMRGRQGSFDKAASAIRMIARSGLISDVVTCVNARNINELPAIKEFLIEAGVRAWRIFTVFPMGRAADDPDMQISPEQMRQVMEFIIATRKEGRIRCNYACEGFLGPYEGLVRDNFFRCNAGISVGSVLADGSISACSSIRADYHQGNIHTDSFWEAWTTRFEKYRDREWMRELPGSECRDCRWFRYCRGGGMHLRDNDGHLLLCHLNKLVHR